MKPLRDEGYFRLYLKGEILIVELENNDKAPSLNYHAASRAFDAIKSVLREHGLTETGWDLLYDLSKVNQYEFTATPIFAAFFSWGWRNGRRRTAHVFPVAQPNGSIAAIKRIMLSLAGHVAAIDSDYYTATDVKDALRWLKEDR